MRGNLPNKIDTNAAPLHPQNQLRPRLIDVSGKTDTKPSPSRFQPQLKSNKPSKHAMEDIFYNDISKKFDPTTIKHDLMTIADYFRFATTQFSHFPLAFGHSTISAEEDAALLLLHYLKLPIEEGLDHWASCRLDRHEREGLIALIKRRIVERYITTRSAAFQGFTCLVSK